MKSFTTAIIIIGASLAPTIVHAVTLTNPLGETDPRLLIARLISGVLSVIGSIALLMFIYGGLLWMTSGGKPEQVKKGKDILIWAVLGIVLIVSAYVVVNALMNAMLSGNVAG